MRAAAGLSLSRFKKSPIEYVIKGYRVIRVVDAVFRVGGRCLS